MNRNDNSSVALNLEIEPYQDEINFNQFQKLEVTPEQKSQISLFYQQIPNIITSGSLANAYSVKFPDGLPNTLTSLKQGGYGAMIKGTNGEFVGTASLYSLKSEALILSSFSMMSIVTGQYFMTHINDELKLMNLKIGEIIDFLYGDKKAELMAEISFIKDSYKNFLSIMLHNEQRIATITGIQEAKKVAMKGIEFYMDDIISKINSFSKNNQQAFDDIFKIKDSLELSMKLFVMSNIMEVQYSQNFDKEYINSVRESCVNYIDKCDLRILSCFSQLYGKIKDMKQLPFTKFDSDTMKKKIASIIENKNNGEESLLKRILNASLNSFDTETEYIINKNGEIFLKM